MKETMKEFRAQHQRALASGKHERAAKIRAEIREHAQYMLAKGYTLKDMI